MSELEKEQIAQMIKGMDEEQLIVVLSVIPSRLLFNELESRDREKDMRLENARTALNV